MKERRNVAQQERSEERTGSINILVVGWDETMIQAGDGSVEQRQQA
jgi:hypothetical protein